MTMAETDILISNTLHNSVLTEELRGVEIEALTRIVTIREYKAGDVVAWQGDDDYKKELRGSLIMLGSGEVRVTYNTSGSTATLNLDNPGDLIAVVGFVGGDLTQVTIAVVAKTDARLLILDRTRFEALLNTQPAIVYYVMRGIARYVHGIVRRLNMRATELTNYLYQTKAR